MDRRLIVLVMLFGLAGCSAQRAPLSDPFFRRTRVPPPGTGTVQAPPASTPYYVNPSGAGMAKPLTPVTQPTAPMQTTPPGQYVPPPNIGYPSGTYQYRGTAVEQTRELGSEGTRVRVPPPALVSQVQQPAPEPTFDRRTASREWSEPFPQTDIVSRGPVAAASSAAAEAGPSDTMVDVGVRPAGYEASRNLLAGRPHLVRTIPPRFQTPAEPTPLAAAATFQTPQPQTRLLPLPGKATDIMDLPAARSEGAARASGPVETFSPYVRYGHAPDYRWLRGKLEYSDIDGRWKLRYIPIDGQTDDYGGSVVLADASLPEGLQRGDFLEVRGKLGQAGATPHGYAPLYETAEIKRLGH